jgi:single-stranded-DNA-specific exonuclease
MLARKAEERWMVYTKRADFDRIAEKFGISPITARILTNRGVTGDDAIASFLHAGAACLPDPSEIPGMAEAADLLLRKIEQQARIRVVGDYDIDGVCSTYILVTALRLAGAEVDYDIPDRILDGYGINENIIRRASEDQVDTIITCDNGIAARDQIALAKELGMTVIVTDHHEVKKDADGRDVLPPADVVIDPHCAGSGFPFPDICGAVVAWKLVRVLLTRAGCPEEAWKADLDFAALATVGDVMPLTGENRQIVKDGLRAIGHTGNPGLRKLVQMAGVDPEHITAYHVGFVIGPCINAGGRLETAKTAMKLFLSEDDAEAEALAAHLVELNGTRKAMTEQETERVCSLVEENYGNDSVLVIYLPECHESLAGIIAGRIRELYGKPTLVLTDGQSAVKGSGRSIEAYNMFAKLSEAESLMLKFGGHPMAAGLSLKKENIGKLRQVLNEKSGLTEEDFVSTVWIDVPVPVRYVTEKLIDELAVLEPFGQGNEKPLFGELRLRIRSCRVLGRNRNVVKMVLQDDTGFAADAVWFGDGDAFEEERAGRCGIDIAYWPELDEWNGRKKVQAVIRKYRFREE